MRFIIAIMSALLTTASFADNTPLEMGEVFTIATGGTDVWVITATETGTMKIVGDNGDGDWIGSCLNVFDDPKMTTEIQTYNWICYEVPVVKDRQYYIRNTNMTGQDYKGKCVMAETFAFTGATPAVGGVFNIVGDCEASLHFTTANVTFTEGELACNGNVTKIYNFTDFNSLVTSGIFTYSEEGTSGMVDYNGCVLGHQDNDGITIPFITQTGREQINVLYEQLSTGKIATGQTMTLNMHGIMNTLSGDLLNGTGELEVTWTVGDMPTALVGATLPETFRSYWTPGDADGIAVFEFSRDIHSAQASIAMGYADAGDRFEALLPVSIEGKQVKVDFTGEMRNAATMGLSTTYPTMEVLLFNVVDANGNPTYASDQGRASSYSYTLPYRDVSGEVSFEITPASGTTLTADITEIEIWYQDTDGIIEADGVDVSYMNGEGEIVSTFYGDQDERITWFVAPDGTTITLPVTDDMRTAANLCVRLNIVKSHDGRSHDIVAYYNTELRHEWDIALMADPKDGTTLHRLSEVFFTLNSTYAINTSLANAATVRNAEGTIVANARFERDGMTNARLVLDKAIVEAGTYTVTVADAAIGDYIFGESHYTSGTCSHEATLTYTVTGNYEGRSIVTEPDEGAVEALQSIRVYSFDYNAIAPSWNVAAMPYVEHEDGTHTPAAFSEDPEPALNCVTVVLGSTITATGKYTLVLPSGALTNAATGDPIQAEYRFTYEILANGIRALHSSAAAPAYNINGQPSSPGARGLLIINGHKVMN